MHIGDPGELAAGLPHLLGYRPQESVVLVALGGESGRRVGLTQRADLPPAEHDAELAAVLARNLATDDPRGRAGVRGLRGARRAGAAAAGGVDAGGGCATDLPHRSLVHRLVLALDAVGLPLEHALLVRGGRWWDFDCPGACCAPGGGTALPTGVGELEVAAVAAGTVVAARPRRPGGAAGAAGRVGARGDGGRWSLRVGGGGARRPVGGPPADPVRRSRAAARAATRSARGTRRSPASLWSLRQPEVRDRALLLSLGDDAAAAEALWTECTRRAPSPLDAFPAALVAVCAWLRGDGAMANIALDRALDSEPGNPLAGLLQLALDACLAPRQLRALLRRGRSQRRRGGAARCAGVLTHRAARAGAALRAGPAAARARRARARPGTPAPSRTRRWSCRG